MGSALLAGFGTGVFDDLAAAANSWVETGVSFEPSPEVADGYRSRNAKYADLLLRLQDWSNYKSDV